LIPCGSGFFKAIEVELLQLLAELDRLRQREGAVAVGEQFECRARRFSRIFREDGQVAAVFESSGSKSSSPEIRV